MKPNQKQSRKRMAGAGSGTAPGNDEANDIPRGRRADHGATPSIFDVQIQTIEWPTSDPSKIHITLGDDYNDKF